MRPPGRRAMCQATVLRNRLRTIGPSGSSGMRSVGRPCWLAKSLTQAVTAAIPSLAPLQAGTSPGRFRFPRVGLAHGVFTGKRSCPSAICSRTRMACTTGGVAEHVDRVVGLLAVLGGFLADQDLHGAP